MKYLFFILALGILFFGTVQSANAQQCTGGSGLAFYDPKDCPVDGEDGVSSGTVSCTAGSQVFQYAWYNEPCSTGEVNWYAFGECSSACVPPSTPTPIPTNTPIPTATPVPPTATPVPTNTPTPVPTNTPTPVPPTPTPVPTATPTPTNTPTPIPPAPGCITIPYRVCLNSPSYNVCNDEINSDYLGRFFNQNCQEPTYLCGLSKWCTKYTGTECCTVNPAGGLGYDYCSQNPVAGTPDCSEGLFFNHTIQCCFSAPTPTPVPTNTPTPTPCPGCGTPTPTPTPIPIICTMGDEDGLGYNETCVDNSGTYTDFCSGYRPAAFFCNPVTNQCDINVESSCFPNNCIVLTNGKPVCDIPPTPTPCPGCGTPTPTPTLTPTLTPTVGPGTPTPTLLPPTPTPTPVPHVIWGRVYYDDNNNGAWDSIPLDRPYDGTNSSFIRIEPGFNDYPINLITGNYATGNTYIAGNVYSVELRNVPIGCTIPPPGNPKSINPMPDSNATVNFPLQECAPPPESTPTPTPTPVSFYSISGTIFNDLNKNERKDIGESNYTGTAAISLNDASSSFGVNIVSGSYSAVNLPSGAYTITFSGLPGGSDFTYPPLTGIAPGSHTLIIFVGPGCSEPSDDASCSAGSIINLNAGVTDSVPSWFQSVGTDLRIDTGFSTALPPSKYASLQGIGGMPGVIFSGNSSPSFGEGQASPNPFNWQVGSFSSPEVFTDTHPIITTSYIFLLETAESSAINMKSASDLCSGSIDISNCILTPGLINGVYSISGDLYLKGTGPTPSYTFPTAKNFVILVNGNLYINEKILVPITSTVIFSVKASITVSQDVGETASSAAPSIEGLYSADSSFIADQTDLCPAGIHKRLNIAGSVIANAGRIGGSFINRRDLCSQNLNYPSITFIERPDFIIYYPNLVTQITRNWRELAP